MSIVAAAIENWELICWNSKSALDCIKNIWVLNKLPFYILRSISRETYSNLLINMYI